MEEKADKGKSKPREMNDHDLLVELVQAQRRTARFQILTAIENVVLILGIAVILIAVLPKALVALDTAVDTLNDVQGLAANAEDTINQLSTDATNSLDGINHMIGNVDTLVEDNTEGISDALNNINNIDFDGLNDAIGNLQDSAEQLQKVTSIFK